jgi:hypothetical protein
MVVLGIQVEPTAASISWSYASLKPPFFARVIGVRRAERKTTSCGFFWRIFLRPFCAKPAIMKVVREMQR